MAHKPRSSISSVMDSMAKDPKSIQILSSIISDFETDVKSGVVYPQDYTKRINQLAAQVGSDSSEEEK